MVELTGETLTPVTATVEVLIFTVIMQVAVFAPSFVLTVMVVDPLVIPVTNPAALTVATAVFDELQVTAVFVALEGATEGVN